VLLLLTQLAPRSDRTTRPLRSIAITATSSLLRIAPPLGCASVLSASPVGLSLSLVITAEGSRSST